MGLPCYDSTPILQMRKPKLQEAEWTLQLRSWYLEGLGGTLKAESPAGPALSGRFRAGCCPPLPWSRHQSIYRRGDPSAPHVPGQASPSPHPVQPPGHIFAKCGLCRVSSWAPRSEGGIPDPTCGGSSQRWGRCGRGEPPRVVMTGMPG